MAAKQKPQWTSYDNQRGVETSAMPSNASPNNGASQAGDGGQEKQKMLLSSETGHFSMIKALHLADLVTELNGFCGGKRTFPETSQRAERFVAN
ncbi:hypothetical protein ATERTT37_005981 [Aspergillus terreus]